MDAYPEDAPEGGRGNSPLRYRFRNSYSSFRTKRQRRLRKTKIRTVSAPAQRAAPPVDVYEGFKCNNLG